MTTEKDTIEEIAKMCNNWYEEGFRDGIQSQKQNETEFIRLLKERREEDFKLPDWVVDKIDKLAKEKSIGEKKQ